MAYQENYFDTTEYTKCGAFDFFKFLIQQKEIEGYVQSRWLYLILGEPLLGFIHVIWIICYNKVKYDYMLNFRYTIQ